MDRVKEGKGRAGKGIGVGEKKRERRGEEKRGGWVDGWMGGWTDGQMDDMYARCTGHDWRTCLMHGMWGILGTNQQKKMKVGTSALCTHTHTLAQIQVPILQSTRTTIQINAIENDIEQGHLEQKSAH